MYSKEKILLPLVIIVLLFISVLLPVAAEKGLDRTYIFDEEEYQLLKGYSAEEPLLSYEKLVLEDRDAENAYMLHWVNCKDFEEALKNGEDLFSLVSYDHSWEIPKDGTTHIYNHSEDGKWFLASIAKYSYTMEGKEYSFISNEISNSEVSERIREIEKKDGKLLRAPVYINAIRYFSRFVLLQSEKNTYLIPYSGRPDFTGLENGRVYECGEAWEILELNYGILPDLSDVDPEMLGGPAYYQDPVVEDFLYQHPIANDQKSGSSLVFFSICAGALIALVLVAVILIRRKRNAS